MESSVKKQLRATYINKIEDIVQAMELCEEYDIPDEGLETLGEYIQRIRLHYYSQRRENYMDKIEDAMLRAGEEDDRKRCRLIQMFDNLIRIVGARDESTKQQFLEDFLSKDGTTENILEDCDRKTRDLHVKETVLMIAGETSAGKSSFLNLLFGMEILPQSTLSCTSTITTIRYGKKQSARVIFMDPDVDDVILQLDGEEGLKQFHEFTFHKNRDVEHGIKEVQVTLPLNFLRSGLVLADTPGVGENEYLEEYLMDYIANNDILGFVYVIFTDAGGGVKEDRLLSLLKLVMKEQKKSKKAFPFDPKATLFVANRFDAVPKESRAIVKAHVLEKLKSCWPNFDESMVVFFSTRVAQRDVTAHSSYVNDNYKQLLQSFSGLFYYVMERRLRISYKWIENVLQRIRHCMKASVVRLGRTERENQERTKKHRRRLHKLQKEADNVIKTLRADIIVKSKELFDDVKSYLSTPMATLRICCAWKHDEIPAVGAEITDPKHWLFVKERVDEAFHDRVCTEIEGWSDEKLKIEVIEESIIGDIQTQLGVLEEEILSSEHEMNRGSVQSNESTKSRASLRRMSMRPTLVEVPMKLPTKVSHRLSGFGRRKETMRFSKDPEKWVKERSEKLLRRLVKNKVVDGATKGSLDLLVEQLMQRPHAILDALEKKIPSMIEANLDLLKTFEETTVLQKRNEVKHEQMAEEIEGLKQSLMNYGEGYIFVNDFKSSEVRIIEEQASSGQSLSQTFNVKVSDLVSSRSSGCVTKRPSLVPHGLWSYLSMGMLQRDGNERPISIKVYLPSSGVTNTFQEVAKLRCLLHNDLPVAEFMGIHHTEAQTPAYIFDRHLQSLQRYMAKSPLSDKIISNILEELAQGLGYLHQKGLIHMEMSPETVTVNDEGCVKLSGTCIPRTATLPIDTEMPVDNFVYLAPEVLNGELYVSSADVFGFGLVMYEVLCNRKAFKDQRSYSFRDFVSMEHPDKMLMLLDQDATGLVEQPICLIRKCVAMSYDERPNMFDVLEEVRGCHGKFKKDIPHMTKGTVIKRSR